MGEYRAPKNRGLRSYYWFCLDHVRGYNASWNYYDGMSADEIEQARRDDVTWNRPSWRLGGVGARSPHPIRDPFGIYEEEVESAHAPPAAPADLPREVRDALAELDMRHPPNRADLKTRYKELSKRHHPDATGGDKCKEERFKRISAAYAVLSRFLDGRRVDSE